MRIVVDLELTWQYPLSESRTRNVDLHHHSNINSGLHIYANKTNDPIFGQKFVGGSNLAQVDSSLFWVDPFQE